MLLYIIKSAITLALLYSCFFLLLSKETFHRFNRMMLMGITIAAFVVPMLHVTTGHPTVVNEEMQEIEMLMSDRIVFIFNDEVTKSQPQITWVQVVEWIYLSGAATMLIITIVQTLCLMKLMHGGTYRKDEMGNIVILTDDNIPPFSIFRFIVMNVKDYNTGRHYIITHEQEHIRQGHSYDLLLLQVLKIMQWFNPFVWFISRDLKTIHEYEADQAVINQGIDAKSYQLFLVKKVVGNRLQPFTNNLNHGSLKKRIAMMYQKKSNRWLMLKSLCAIPVIALTISAFATPSNIDTMEAMVNKLDEPPFAIHPVRDQYGRITGFSHEGKPTNGDIEYTYEYIFINGRPATDEEVRNYQTLPIKVYSIIKTANGSAEYNYKDQHGVICFTLDEDEMKTADEPLIVIDGKVVDTNMNVDMDNLRKDPEQAEDMMEKLLGVKRSDIESITVLQKSAATAIYSERGKNGVIEIKTKRRDDVVPDSLLNKLPGMERQPDGSYTINGKKVKKVLINGEAIEMEQPKK